MLTVTTAAADMIHRSLRTCALASPVVYLGQVSNTPTELEEAIKRGASPEAIREAAPRMLESEPRYLYPLIYPRSRFLWFFTTTVAGMRFASRYFYPPEARSALTAGTLDLAERGLILRDANGAILLPKQPGCAR